MSSNHRNKGFDHYSTEMSSRFGSRFRRWKRFIPFLLILAVVAIGTAAWLVTENQRLSQTAITAKKSVNVGTGYRNITFQGQNYSYNNRITTILYAGVDSDTPLVQTAKYTLAPRADSISLIVLDELHRKMTVIALSRDTMTEIRRYSMSGKKSGLYVDHLGYAYTYGDGGKASCDGLCEAVSLLLYGIPVTDYVISNRASMEIIGNMIGPVDVTVPNADLAEIDPIYSEGAHVTIDVSNLELFVRHRDKTEYFSNVGRMQRQQAYIIGAMNQVRSMLINQPEEFWKNLQTAEQNVQTNIARNRYLELTRIMKNTTFSNRDYYIPDGKQVAGKYHDEFYPDETSLLAKVIEIFYIRQ